MTVGQQLREMRIQKGVGLRELARRAGMDAGSLRRIETGEVKSPQWDTVIKLADSLDVPITDLIAETPSPAPITQEREVNCG